MQKDARKTLQTSKNNSLERLRNFRKTVDKIFNKLEGEAKEEINDVYAEDEYILDRDIETCDDILASLRLQKHFMESKCATEPQMFLKVKQIRQMLTEYDSLSIMREPKISHFEDIEFIADPKVLNFIEKIESLRQKTKPEEEQETDPEVPVSTSHKDMNDYTGSTADVEVQNSMLTTQNADLTEATSTQSHKNRRNESEKQSEQQEEASNVQLTTAAISVSAQQVEKKQGAKSKNDVVPPFSRSVSYHSSNDTRALEKMQEVKSKKDYVPTFSTSVSYHSSNATHAYRQYGFQEEGEAPKVQQINIKLPEDKCQCNIQGMFGLENGNIILSDTKNKKLKVIDQSYKIISSRELPAGPRGVCGMDDNKAVTAMSNKTIQFVTFDNAMAMELTGSIQLSHDCYGLTNYKRKLYVTKLNGNCVYVYDTDGKALSTISGSGLDGSSRFVSTQHVYITRDGSRIYVADTMKGLVAVTAKGLSLSASTQTGLLSACGVCTDKSGNVYVSGWQSHNVVKYGERGTKARGVILSSDNNINYPTSIWFNSFKSHMIVSNNPEPNGSDVLNVVRIEIE